MDRKRSDILKYEKKMPLETVERLNTQRTKILMGEIKQYRQPKKKISVKSRLLCKMLYNVFTISTYQN
ncbi:hypothetical protein [Enterococcus faecalis]|uniref:hypothetical protein n=1 Tax=Enterococcus faecalis TaxID=1351 RepID=UPI00287F688C|nr:hypothetical protein [Enterococcus faecalis]